MSEKPGALVKMQILQPPQETGMSLGVGLEPFISKTDNSYVLH